MCSTNLLDFEETPNSFREEVQTSVCFTGKLHGVPLIVILLISKIIESSTVPVAQF